MPAHRYISFYPMDRRRGEDKNWYQLPMAERARQNPAGRFGEPDEFGLACAFLCADKAGFITGQNILLDGGAFPGTL